MSAPVLDPRTGPDPTDHPAGRPVVRRHARGRLVVVALALACTSLALVALATGSFEMSPGEVVGYILDPAAGYPRYLVLEERLPRIVVALAFGAALGLSGAIFQSLTRNPLGSPDIIGFSTGSYTGALIVLTVAGAGFASTAVGALVGGIGTALVVYVLAWRGGVAGFRLIIVGIAVTALLTSVNTWLLLRADLEVAVAAAIWGAGSLTYTNWGEAIPALVLVAALVPAVAVLRGPLRQLELGDDAARGHGVRVEPMRLLLLLVGVALVATVTAVAGPIVFVALAAPQVAHRLCRSAGLPLVASALTGALLLLLADVVAQHLLPVDVPVGVVTVVVGGVYLLWLLAAETGRRTS